MPRPPTSARPTGRADREGRHRPGRQVPGRDDKVGGGWNEAGGRWDEEPVSPAAAGLVEPIDADLVEPMDADLVEPADADLVEPVWEDLVALAGDSRVRLTGEDRGQRVPLISVPESLRSVDVRVGARAVRGLLLLVVVVVLVLGGRWWWVQQGADAAPVGEAGPDAGGVGSVQAGDSPAATAPVVRQEVSGGHGAVEEPPAGAPDEGPAGPATDGPATEGPAAVAGGVSVVVHVVGEVRRPGIVELPAGARVADAVSAAGGLTDAADQTSLNLARALVDGEQVWVGAPGEEPPAGVLRGSGPPTGGTGGGAGAAPGGGPDAPPALLDLNQATQADLEELPGVGPVTAGRVLAWREEHGRFSAVEELMEVSGIGERTFAQLEPLVTVGG